MIIDLILDEITNKAADAAKKVGSFAAEHTAEIVTGAVAAASAAVGTGIAVHANDEKKFKKRSKDIYKLGYKEGSEYTSKKAKKELVDPILAKLAIAYYVAQADGKVSKEETNKINNAVGILVSRNNFPQKIQNEINKITNNSNLTFEDVSKYLDKVSLNKLNEFDESLYQIASNTSNVSYKEKAAINEFEDYILNRANKKLIKNEDDKNFIQEFSENHNEVDEYFDSLVTEDEIEKASNIFLIRQEILERQFKARTKLNSKEISLLMVATALQCSRIYLVNFFSKKEIANHGEKENFLKEKQEKLLGKLHINKKDKPKPYYAPLEEIITTRGVPYDTTNYATENLKIFSKDSSGKGVNHRFATLGHDPLVGLLVGTTNIMTNTLTSIKNKIPTTYHITYDDNFSNPKILNKKASFTIALENVAKRTKEDPTPLVAALVKQLIHIATDTYTPAGIPLPGSSLVFNRTSVEEITEYINFGDLAKYKTSDIINELINKIISAIHACMLKEDGEYLCNELNTIKTIKIIDYSNVLATSSNIITNYVTKQYEKLDYAGAIALIKRIFNDNNFIYDIKYEFIKDGLFNKKVVIFDKQEGIID